MVLHHQIKIAGESSWGSWCVHILLVPRPSQGLEWANGWKSGGYENRASDDYPSSLRLVDLNRIDTSKHNQVCRTDDCRSSAALQKAGTSSRPLSTPALAEAQRHFELEQSAPHRLSGGVGELVRRK
jgi:hypothetical protein